ncbi:MAG: acetate uptake transporter family protein [Desulfocucumaceae bacterium]
MNAVNPEVIGVFGLIVTVWCIGLEQMGFGIKDGDHKEIGKSLAYIAIFFGGFAQITTAIAMYFFNVAKDPGLSIYLGTIFANYGLFWLVIATFFLKGGDKKMIAHFFIVQFLITCCFIIKAVMLGLIWPLAVCLFFIAALFAVLVPAWYGKGAIYTKLAGFCNIMIGLTAIPLFLHALGI